MPYEDFISILYQTVIRKVNQFKQERNGLIVKFITKKEIVNNELLMLDDKNLMKIFNPFLNSIQYFRKQN